ncbi:hypothetical protein QE424_001785 [Stenotrophomonas rhizophila]|jgi:hypothetical protein|uniref:Uncharacterized protein n=1 Tax=Stenotrophomonas rhizophila TaxID=216778 RepID=A0AAP5AI34_9GAMM|nr:hypothetical protein [Stenotrophomonas rhizophila]MDQ1108626.1 hypothetical protein [Stenotrophomonas rhizophila]
MHDDWTSLTPEQRALLRGFWRAPKSVMINALHHEGLETYPGCPTIPCLKARGLWMRGLGVEPGTRMYLGVGRELFVLAKDPSPEALSKAMVRFEKTGGSWKLGPVG